MKRKILPLFLIFYFFQGIVFAQTADLAITNFAANKESVSTLESIQLQLTLENQGDKDANASKIKYYLSEDSVFSSGDIYFGEQAISAISAGQTISAAGDLQIPSDIYTDYWYILAVANVDLDIDESNFSNNTKSVYLFVKQSPESDIYLSQISFADTVTAGQILPYNFTVQNLGEVAAPGFHTGLYLSVDSVFDVTDEMLTENYLSSLAAGSNYTQNGNMVIPVDEKAYFYILCVADNRLSVFEKNEYNNIAYKKLYIQEAPKPDLIIDDVSSPNDSVLSGTQVTINYSVQNVGDAYAGASYLGYYLSDDAILDQEDPFLASSLVAGLDVNAMESKSVRIVIPDTCSEGIKYIFLKADYSDAIGEKNEDNNNSVAVAVDIKEATLPDLIIPSAYKYNSADSIIAGNNLKLACNARNIGGVVAPASNLGIYLSKDIVYDENDVYLGSEQIESLSASQSTWTRFPVVKIPENTAEGKWYVIFYVDDNQDIDEANENNNTVVDSIIVKAIPVADLIVSDAIVSPDKVKASDSLDVSSVVANIGEVKSGESYLGYYLSEDTLLDNNDVFLAEDWVDTLSVNNSSSLINNKVQIPVDTKEGDYYFIFVADYSDLISEANEDNNLNYKKIYVNPVDLPDLAVTDARVNPDTLKQGEDVALSAVVKNIGKLKSNECTFMYVLSEDTIYQAGLDLNLKELYIDSLDAFVGQLPLEDTLTIPAYTDLGKQYILLMVDAYDQVTESEKLNNIAYVPIEVEEGSSPDLVISEPLLSVDSLKPGEKLSLQYVVNNFGNAASSGSYTKFYLSDDFVLDSTDLFIGSQQEASLAAFVGTQSREKSITIPDTISSGIKYIIIQADGQEYISESNEENNTASIAVYIETPDLCDLGVSASFHPVELFPGEKITTGIQVDNRGEKTAPASELAFYLSRDAVFNLEEDTILNSPKDILLTTFSIDTIVEGGVYAKNEEFYLPDTISSGIWYIIYYIDYDEQVREMNEENNFGFSEIKVDESPKPDLVPSVSGIDPAQVQAGKSARFISLVKNIGEGAAASSRLNFYLSMDTLISVDDIWMGASNVPSLTEVTGLEQIIVQTTIPYEAKLGTWYCIVSVDDDDLIAESNEYNNMAYKSFTVTAPPYPDILVDSASINPTEITAGQNVDYSYQVENIGDTTAMNVPIKYYISSDILFDSEDVELNKNYNISLVKGDSVTINGTSLTIPFGTRGGDKFILFVADPDSAFGETNKDNNVAYAPITVLSPPRPDWAMINSTIFPDMVDINVPDNDFVVRYELENKGEVYANKTDVVFYLSKDTLYSQNDILISSQQINGLDVGLKQTNLFHLNIADTIDVGNWYLLTYIDGYSKYTELSEDNNIGYNEIKIVKKVPDLHPLGTQLLPYTIYLGETINSSCLIENRDLGNAPSNYLALYLSKDTTISADDIFIKNEVVSDLSSGAKLSLPVSFSLSGDIVEGSYYLLFSVDDSSMVDESVESNNVIYHAFNLKESVFPDLMFSKNINLSAGTYYPDDTLNYSFTVKNEGNSPADNIYYSCYLSNDDSLDMDDELIQSDIIEKLYQNNEISISNDYLLENKFDDGNYYLFVVLDEYNNIVEANDSNNIVSIEFEISHNAAVPNVKGQIKVNLYPNPVAQNLSVDLSNEFYGEFDIVIYDLSQKTVYKLRENKLSGDYKRSIDVSDMKPGIYFMSFRFDNYFVVKKFVKY